MSQRYTAAERDAESTLDFLQARYLANMQARFVSADPAGYLAADPANPQSWNMYSYAGNNPLAYIDPTGLDPCPPGSTADTCVTVTDTPDPVDYSWSWSSFWNSIGAYFSTTVYVALPPPLPPSKPPTKPNTPACNDKDSNRSRFFQQVPGIVDVAKQLKVPNGYLVGLASYESGWLDNHNFTLNNLWGLTQAGGNNIQFSSFKAGNDYFVNRVGPYIQASQNVPDFFAGLKKEGYDSANPDCFSLDPNKGMLFNRISNIGRWAQACGASF